MKRYPLLILFLAALLVGVGLWGYVWSLYVAIPYAARKQIQINNEVQPHVAAGKQVRIIATAPGLGIKQMEPQVTGPLELALAGLPGFAAVRVDTTPGRVELTAVFDNVAGSRVTQQSVRERLQKVRAQLPPGVKVQIGAITAGG